MIAKVLEHLNTAKEYSEDPKVQLVAVALKSGLVTGRLSQKLEMLLLNQFLSTFKAIVDRWDGLNYYSGIWNTANQIAREADTEKQDHAT